MMRPDSGTMARAANATEVNKLIQDLQQELVKSKAETQRSRDKLNCLISLIRRSWNGDRNALLHLSNIVGMEAPSGHSMDGIEGRPSSMMQTGNHATQTRAEHNWERLTVRLLEMENDVLQQEIRKYQQRYIENRTRYMDEVMTNHYVDMARLPIAHSTSAKHASTLAEVDRQFLQQHRHPVMRARSAVQARRNKKPRDMVHAADVRLRDLFVGSTSAVQVSSDGAATDASLAGLTPKEKEVVRKARSNQAYDDTRRYLQGNLFSADEMLTKRTRPVSASVLRERDARRARPRSSSFNKTETTVFMTEAEGRPMKFETTHPVSGKKPPRKKSVDKTVDGPRITFAHTTHAQETPASHNPPSPPSSPQQQYILPEETVDDIMNEAAQQTKPPISVHVKNAIKTPEGVNRLTNDLRNMEEMQELFQRDAKALQKRLGLPTEGIV